MGFKGFTMIQAWGEALTVLIDQNDRSWGLASVGWPLVEMTLQSGSAPVVLTGISVAYAPLVLGERRRG